MDERSKPAPVDVRLLASLARAFEAHARDDSVIDFRDLQRALGIRAEYLARRVVAALDEDGDGVIRKDEFIAGVRKVLFGSVREKLRFAFTIHDLDGDGVVEPIELVRMITLALAEDDLTVREGDVDRLAQRVFAEADRNGDQRISFEEFASAVEARPALLDQMTRNEARWIAPNEDLLARVEERGAPARGRFAELVENRWGSIVVVGLFVAANAALFTKTMLQHPRRPTPELLMFANACAACLNLDVALILVPVLRRLLTRVRATWLGRLLPIDDAIEFHRLVGYAIVLFGIGHGVGHFGAYLSGKNPHLRSLLSKEGMTGLVLVAVVVIMWFFARGAIRRTRHFGSFYVTHLLYVVVFVLAAFHAPALLGWASLPLFGLVVEQVSRLRRRGRVTSIEFATTLRSGVTRLAVAKPKGFTHRAGDYVFLRVPALARHEWHPFTISSAPESDLLTVHVRSLGNWTAALRSLVEARASTAPAPPLLAHLDGPDGLPSGHVFESRYAVLIGAGIGVTPFASVLESLVWRANGKSDASSKLEKLHFFWLNRDQYSFEWFAALLGELERVDRVALLDIQIRMTGGRGGFGAAGLEVARELGYVVGERDLVTGLRAKTQMGHPDWEASLAAIRDAHAPARVDVFFCGPPGLGRTIRAACARLGLGFREERF